MKINFQDLQKKISYKWRVQSFSKFSNTATCVPYIEARAAMALLDEVCGPENWRDEYQVVKDNLFCGISIQTSSGIWVTKWDVGTESNVEKEKGEASDAFKRAGVKWGIGRFLYEIDIVRLKTNDKKTDSNYPYVIKENGERVWDLTTYISGLSKAGIKVESPPPVKQAEVKATNQCSICSKPITEKEAYFSANVFKRYLCYNCQKKAKV